jgi:hypothetical protein
MRRVCARAVEDRGGHHSTKLGESKWRVFSVLAYTLLMSEVCGKKTVLPMPHSYIVCAGMRFNVAR